MKKIFLLFLCIISYTYPSERINFKKVLRTVKRSDPFNLRFLMEIRDLQLTPEQKQALMMRLILTGNKENLSLFFYYGVLNTNDINDATIEYAEHRTNYNIENYKILDLLKRKQHENRLNRKRKVQEEERDDNNKEKNKKRRLNPKEERPPFCGICLEKYTKTNKPIRMMPEEANCLHEAHQKCFERWCTSAQTRACIFCNNGKKERKTPIEWDQWIFG